MFLICYCETIASASLPIRLSVMSYSCITLLMCFLSFSDLYASQTISFPPFVFMLCVCAHLFCGKCDGLNRNVFECLTIRSGIFGGGVDLLCHCWGRLWDLKCYAQCRIHTVSSWLSSDQNKELSSSSTMSACMLPCCLPGWSWTKPLKLFACPDYMFAFIRVTSAMMPLHSHGNPKILRL